MNICYVILHYNAIDVTQACVESILKIKEHSNNIVIVDNNSPNGSGNELKKIYHKHKDIYIIQNSKNEGFARGNNLGYRFAREHLDASIIVDMNNDIEILNGDFESKVLAICESEKRIAIVSPRIKNIKGYDQNPYRLEPMNSKRKLRTALVYSMYSIGLLIPGINKKLYSFFSSNFHTNTLSENLVIEPRKDIVPHGSFLIFCPAFIKKFKNAFAEDTFFYGEEDILYDMVKKHNLDILYKPEIEVLHKEKIATSTIASNEIKRVQFASKNKARSAFSCLKHRLLGYKGNIA